MKWRLTLELYDDDNTPITKTHCDFNISMQQMLEPCIVGVPRKDMLTHAAIDMVEMIDREVFGNMDNDKRVFASKT